MKLFEANPDRTSRNQWILNFKIIMNKRLVSEKHYKSIENSGNFSYGSHTLGYRN